MSTLCTSAPAGFSFTYVAGGAAISGSVTLQDFSLSLGIGSGSSTLDLSFLYGGCNNVSDIPTILPRVGRAVRFQCNALVFGGIVHESTYSVTPSGFIFKIKIIDPKKILENVTVLYKDYYCPIYGIANFINVFDKLEPGVAQCPPGEDTENWPRVGSCNFFGNSALSGYSPENGVQTYKVLQALGGETVYTTAGDRLSVDLGVLTGTVVSRAFWSRLSGESDTLSGLIDKACQDIACDYFVELVGNRIVVILIDRSQQANLGVIQGIVGAAKQTGTLLSSEEGSQEIYEPSCKIIIGDKVQYLADVSASNRPVAMMMGYDSKGNPQRVYNNNFTFVLDIRTLKLMGIPIDNDDYYVSEEEIICSGSQQMWLLYGLTINKNSLSAAVINALGLKDSVGTTVIDAYNVLFNANSKVIDWKAAMNNLSKISSKASSAAKYALYDQAYSWFKSFVNEWYAKRYLIPVNNFCRYPTSNASVVYGDTGQYYLSDVPSDGGYPSKGQLSGGIRGLSVGVDTTIFETPDNRISGFVDLSSSQTNNKKIAGKDVQFKLAPREMDNRSYIIKNDRIYLKASAAGQPIFTNSSSPYPEVLIETESAVAALPYFGAEKTYLLNKGLRAFTVLFGTDKYDELKNKDKGFSDVTSFNIFEVNFAAGGISNAVVPMKSNVYVYGPFIGGGGALGTTKVNIVSDLNPWNYGGWTGLYQVGNALASQGIRITNISENGSFTLAEPPGYNVQYFLQAGIFVDNINVNYNGSGGVTTTYSFKTFSKKYADYGQAIASLVRESNTVRSQVLDKIKNQRRQMISSIYGALSNVSKALSTKVDWPQEGMQHAASPGFLIMGGYYDKESNNSSGGGYSSRTGWSSEKKAKDKCRVGQGQPSTSQASNGGNSYSKLYEIGLNAKHEIEDAVNGAGFKNIAIMSMDGLLSPVSLAGRDGGLARFSKYNLNANAYTGSLAPAVDRTSEGENKLNKSRPSMPPIFANGSPQRIPINQKFLNPILSTKLLNDWGGRGVSAEGFNIQYVGFGTQVSELENKTKKQEQTDYGFAALRGPLVLQSWGYDTENKPIPNIIDSPASAEAGTFKSEGTKNNFLTNWLENPKTWPVGPIDLRWDRDRGVWVCPPSDRIIVAQLLTDLPPYGSVNAILLNPKSQDGLFYENYGIYGPGGENLMSDITASTILISDFLGRNLCKGTVVYAAFNDGKYIVLESSAVNQEQSECLCSTTTTDTTTTTTETTTGTTTTETTPPTESECPDICGLKECLSGLGSGGAGIIGLDDSGCLTIYELTSCESPSPSP